MVGVVVRTLIRDVLASFYSFESNAICRQGIAVRFDLDIFLIHFEKCP